MAGVHFDDISWLRRSRRRSLPGEGPAEPIVVSVGNARKLLVSLAHRVADIPKDSPPEVVWMLGSNELLVHTDSIRLACTSGLVRIGIDVECDQIEGRQSVTVPLAVGTKKQARGLLTSTFSRIDGPAEVVDVWSDALTAFAWEALLELAKGLCAEVGRDRQGRPLIPYDITAASNQLIVSAMARHDATASAVT